MCYKIKENRRNLLSTIIFFPILLTKIFITVFVSKKNGGKKKN